MKALRLEGTPEQKRKATVLWIETIKDLLRTNTQTSEILKDYPKLPKLPKQLLSNENKALDSILRANMAHNVKQMLNGTPRDDGLSTLLRIQQLHAPASIKDRNDALKTLNALQLEMHPYQAAINFVQRSQAIKELQNANHHFSLPPKTVMISHLTNKYLEATPDGPDVRNIQSFYV